MAQNRNVVDVYNGLKWFQGPEKTYFVQASAGCMCEGIRDNFWKHTVPVQYVGEKSELCS
jgi:hypothetical protein